MIAIWHKILLVKISRPCVRALVLSVPILRVPSSPIPCQVPTKPRSADESFLFICPELVLLAAEITQKNNVDL